MSLILALLKPDAVRRHLCEEILNRLRAEGFQMIEVLAGRPSRDLIQEHYANLASRGGSVLERNVGFLAEQPVVKLVVEGEIPALRRLIGATEPVKAQRGTIRGDLATDSIEIAEQQGRGLHNLIHASGSEESAIRELQLWHAKFHVEPSQQAIEILRLTQDGNALSPFHLHLLQESANRNLNQKGQEAFQMLYAYVIDGSYARPWLAGVEHVTADTNGYVYWKGIQIEHFSLNRMNAQAIREGAVAISRTCRHLEAIGIPVTTGNYLSGWLEDVDQATPDYLKQALSKFPSFYENPDGRVAFELAAPRDQSGWPTEERYPIVQGEQILLHQVPGKDAHAHHLLTAEGFKLPDCGQGPDRCPVAATGHGVMQWYKRVGMDEQKMQRVLQIHEQNLQSIPE